MEESKTKEVIATTVAEPAPAPVKEKKVTTDEQTEQRENHVVTALLGTFGVAAWITLFSLGMLIDSSTFRTALTAHFSWSDFMMSVLTFTPTNIALLCLVSSFSGGCASLLVISKAQKVLGIDKHSKDKTDSQVYMSENPFSSMMRGIIVFFAFLAGVFVTSSNALSEPTAQAYTQAAGIVSLLAFIVGYDPSMFKTLISVGEKMKGGS